mmetsp:Transcript_10522/g.23733  ORF Transcript_10522/g.23733 Transcript_10522/m.23733 type:complete len:207 (+) Transcript_10522:1423-2043(+)
MSAPGPPLLEEDEDDAFFGEEVVVFFAGLAAAAAGFLEASFASFAFSSSDLFWGGATMRLVFLSASPLIPLFGLASIPEIPLELLRSSSTYASCEEAVSDLADGRKLSIPASAGLFIERKKGVVATKADKSADRREDDGTAGGLEDCCEDARTVVVTLREEVQVRTRDVDVEVSAEDIMIVLGEDGVMFLPPRARVVQNVHRANTS